MARQAAKALHYSRPAGWLAVALFAAQRDHPAAMARARVRHNVESLATSLASSGDYRSGARSRPGRQVSAAIAGCEERTVENWHARWQAEGLIKLTKAGRLLRAEERLLDPADPYPVPDESDERWRDAAEYTLIIPEWVKELTDEQLWPYLIEATRLLAERARAARVPESNFAERVLPLDAGDRTFALSLALDLYGSLPVKRGSFSIHPRTLQRVRRPSRARPAGRKTQKGRPTGVSPTRKGSGSSDRTITPEALRVAREIVTGGFLPFLGWWAVQGVAERLLALPQWGSADVEAYIQFRLRDTGKPLMTRPGSPVHYFGWLLMYADPDNPPAQALARVRNWHEEQRRAQHQRYVDEAAAIEAASVAGRPSPGRAAALAAARAAAERGRVEQSLNDQAYAGRAAVLDQVPVACDWPEVRMPGSGLLVLDTPD